MNYSFLSTFGLTEKEVVLYEILLSSGQLLVGDIIKKSKLKRATVYQSLYSLEKKGLVSQIEISGKIHFKPEPPTQLLQLANSQLKIYEESHNQLMSVISALDSKYILAIEKPVISVFEGVNGLKEIYNDMISTGKPVYAALTTDEIDPALQEWLDNVHVKERAKKKIHAYVLVAGEKNTTKYLKRDKEEARTTKIVDKNKYPFMHEIDIYGSKVAFINYRKGQNLLGVVIHHPLIAATQKALFDLAWDQTPES